MDKRGITMTQNWQPNDTKLKELILFIALHSEGDKRFGATKLNKLLFFADFLAYLYLGKPITGHEYQALPKGPAPRYLMPIREAMEVDKDIAIQKIDFYGREQHKIFALREPDLSLFTAEEIELVHHIIEECWNKRANDISDDSHRFVGWALAGPGETIPYEVALVSTTDPTPADIAYAKELEPLALEYLTQC